MVPVLVQKDNNIRLKKKNLNAVADYYFRQNNCIYKFEKYRYRTGTVPSIVYYYAIIQTMNSVPYRTERY